MRRLINIIKWVIATSKQANRSCLYIVFDFLRQHKKALVSKKEYVNYGFYNADDSFRESFLSFGKAWQLWEELNPRTYACIARDKYISHCLLKRVNIPTSELYIYYHPQLAENTDAQAYNYAGVVDILKKRNIQQCVIKPSQDSAHGHGVFVCYAVEFDGDKCLLKRYDGTRVDLKDILHATPLLFESLIKQSEQFASFNSTSVNTIRMMTALYPDNTVRMYAGWMKIGRQGSDVDNAGDGGNVNCKIDLATGQILSSVEFNSWDNVREITHHPDSDAELVGEYIHNWDMIVKQVCSFQARMPQLKVIGWDVAITEHGPMIIEFNNWWDPTGQLFIGKGWKNEVLECYNAWHRDSN